MVLDGVFNNRELAISTWLLFGFLLLILYKSTREQIGEMLRILTSRIMLVNVFFILSYLTLVVYSLYLVRFWDFIFLKETLIWLFTVGLVSVYRVVGKDEEKIFKRIMLDSLKITIMLEFFVNVKIFSFWIEFIVILLAIFIAIIQIVAKDIPKLEKLPGIIDNGFTLIALSLFIYGLIEVTTNYRMYVKLETLQEMLMPSLLTILFIPFIYLFALYARYESLFVRVNKIFSTKSEKRKIKIYIIMVCGFSLSKIEKLLKVLDMREVAEHENPKLHLKDLLRSSI